MSERSIAREKEAARMKEHENDVRQLREFDDFAKFSDSDLKKVVKASHRTSTSGPWPLIREQTVSDACYILLSGEAGVYVGQNLIATVGPGEVIGESAIKRGKLRGATVTTTGRAEVLHIDRDDLDRLLDEVPQLRELIDATVARRVPEAAKAD
jgi:CRP/FNR family transcriptional regulator, cyclic AMP receptor protein